MVIACLSAADAMVPMAALADPVGASNAGSPGGNADDLAFSNGASLTLTGHGSLVGVSSTGGYGDPNGGSAGNVTVQNIGALTYAAPSQSATAPGTVRLIEIVAKGGYGADSGGSNGGIGGNSSVGTLTLTNSGAMTASGTAFNGLSAIGAYDIAGYGGNNTAITNNNFGGNGGSGQLVSLTNHGSISLGTASSALTGNTAALAIDALSQGGNAGGGACSNVGALLANQHIACGQGDKDHAGNGGTGGTILISNDAPIAIYWNTQPSVYSSSTHSMAGISAVSTGGDGSSSRSNFASGGLGGQTGAITIYSSQSITLSASGSLPVKGAAIYALARGGQGGGGNEQDAGGNGVAGAGGATFDTTQANPPISISVSHGGAGAITTTGDELPGIIAQARGGAGGAGGSDWASSNSNGGVGGAAGRVTVVLSNTASIATSGNDSGGILAQSIGGIGGAGGNDGGLVGTNGGAGMGGAASGSSVSTSSGTVIRTAGDYSVGITAQTIGGGGGAGSDFVGVLGGQGGQGGRGGNACMNGAPGCPSDATTNILALGTIATSGVHAYGLLAQSIGGGGGVGGIADGLVYTLGGAGGAGGSGGGVRIDNGGTVTTSGYGAHAIMAQSVGGGGGAAGVSEGAISVGGYGATAYAAPGGRVVVNHWGLAQTANDAAVGILAQSVGGGGGSGAGSTGVIAVGGTGSAGGDGGSVQVGVSGIVQTAGNYSHGVVAQSVGGGGGSGGDVQDFSFGIPTVGIGGSSAGGGAGGDVAIDFSGYVTTVGNHAAGLIAQSTGGGGGIGGDVSTTGLLAFATFSIGGGASTAGGGAGGRVTVDTSGTGTPTIRSAGSFSTGVLAQSIGGGGGNGGNSSGYDVNGIFAVADSVGGAGGNGGNGGRVSVNWQGGSITTGTNMRAMSTAAGQPIALTGQAGNAYGLLAQSIGGGGGNGGSAAVDQLVGSAPSELLPIPTVNLTSSAGGVAGGGGSGGVVDVTIGGTSIVTWGAGAHAVLAQSIGGGGGTGGDASSLSVAAAIPSTNDLPTISVSAAIGASGGSGGSGQAVAVSVDQSTLTTWGDNANAVAAQSIGGGGGDGGVGSASTYTLFEAIAPKVTIGVGGTGTAAGNGGEVDVTVGPGAIINTVGSGSRGVVAQSIGGGGGMSQGGTIGLSVGAFTGKVEVGRTGAGGGQGGSVNVTSSGQIATLGNDADGILAQSIGGGGGLGGTFGADGSWDNPNWINVVWDVQRVIKALSDLSAGYSMTVTVGGQGGGGGAGNTVNINHTGVIATTGDWADGIVAQSIGGGGGVGGSAVADGSQQTAAISVGVGGQGGASGDGGAVTIQNAGTIVTQGFAAYGLLAQSIGGGGGQGGDGSAKSTGSITVGFAGGGGGGNSGQGGIVQLLDSASGTRIMTRGDYAHGMVLQSIGGGGGVGGAGNSNSGPVSQNQGYDIVVGGGGGSAGNGCAVAVGGATVNPDNCQVTATGAGTTVTIQTQGQGAFGLVAQSIGGGGGIGGAANAASIASITLGGAGGPPPGDSGGASGNGGMVSLYLADSQISTSGIGAHAIVAQSVGGGGGIAGDLSGSPVVTGVIPVAGTGSIGDGGNVTVVTGANSKILTSGDYAFGILAQSIGGGGGLSGSAAGVFAGANFGRYLSTSGDVSVTVGGVVGASGYNAIGVFAQSAANNGGGAISVNVNGTVIGGSGGQGAGVHLAGGNSSNAITIGTQGSIYAASGRAISYSGNYAPAVTNNGTLQGDILLRNDLGTVGTLANRGTLIAGGLLDANVTNSGSLAVLHSSNAFATTHIAGNFTQSSTGSVVIGGDLTTGISDRLQIGGTATLDGRIGFNFRTLRPNQPLVVLTADGGITGKLTPDNGPGLFDFQLRQTGNALSVSAVGANFAGSSFGLNAHQAAVARGLQDIWNAGGGTFDTLFVTLQSLAAGGGYADALSKLSPGVALASAARSRDNVQEFSNNLMSCPAFENDTALVGETSCTWARVGGRLTNQTSSGGVAGFNNNLMSYQLGTQWEIAPDWFLGGSIAYQQSWLSGTDGRVNTTGNGGSAGLALKRQAGPWLFAASIGGSLGWYDTKRLIAIPGFTNVAYGNSSVLSGQGRLRAAYSFVFQDWYVRPYADFDVIHVRTPGYSESGAGALGLTYDTASQWTAAFSPTVEVGGRVNLAKGYVLRPYGSLGVSFFSNSDWTASARLQGGLGAGSFTTSIATDPVVARFSAGIQLFAQDRLDFKLTYDGAFSEHTVSNALSLRAALRF